MEEELKKLREQYAAKMAEAKSKLAEVNEKKAKPSDVDAILGQADEIKVKIDLIEKMIAGDAYLDGSDGPKAAHLGWRDSGPEEGISAVDSKAWRETEIENAFGRKVKIRFQVPLAVQPKGYAPAFEAYIRRGFDNMGPNDRKTLSEGVDTAGGFLTPEDQQTELIKKVAVVAVIRQNARVIQTSRDVVKWPRINYTTDDRYTSGVRMIWTGEVPASAAVHRVTDPVFGEVRIEVHTAMASMPLTNSLLEDSAFDVFGIGTDLIGEAFGLGEDDVFINGSGVGRPQGILSQVNGAGPASINSGTAADVTADGMIDLFYGLPAQYRRNARFMFNSQTMSHIEKLQDATNRYLVQPLQISSIASPPFDTIKGKPILPDEFMPDIATDAYAGIFGDLQGYFVVDRVGTSIQRLSELYAETDVTLLLARKRVGGYAVEPYRMKVLKIAA